MVVLEQVEQQRGRLVQTGVGRNKGHRIVQQVLLHRRREKWQSKDVFQGHVKKSRTNLYGRDTRGH